ncbi:MAG: hypothetical protein KBD06_01145 [Candidatus Pacebacteria bacterium]|nr:hypothetical protein [Candidatus Paceibacterota bacterium]
MKSTKDRYLVIGIVSFVGTVVAAVCIVVVGIAGAVVASVGAAFSA